MTQRVSIIIVNYNSGSLLEKCVASIHEHITSVDYEVLVVDNGSSDSSVNFISKMVVENPNNIRLIRNQHNEGFAVANNIGARLASGKYLHFLNPDTLVTPSLKLAYMNLLEQRAERVVYTTRIVDHSGRLVKTNYLLPTIKNYVLAIVRPSYAKYWHIGASVIIDRDVFQEIRGWPEDYFMYAEDLDLFYQIAQRGIPVISLNATVIHTSKGTTEKVWSEYERLVRIEKSYRKFCSKYNRMLDYYVIRIFNVLRTLLRDPKEAKMMMSVMKSALQEA